MMRQAAIKKEKAGRKKSKDKLYSETELGKLAEGLRNGVSKKEKEVRGKVYQDASTAADIVQWLRDNVQGCASRQDAEALGELLVGKYIKNISGEGPFKTSKVRICNASLHELNDLSLLSLSLSLSLSLMSVL